MADASIYFLNFISSFIAFTINDVELRAWIPNDAGLKLTSVI